MRMILTAAFAIALAIRCAGAGQADITALLEGWDKPSATAYQAAQQHYRELASQEWRAAYAMALLAAKQYKLQDASTYVDEALAAGGPQLRARQLRAWILATRGDSAGV